MGERGLCRAERTQQRFRGESNGFRAGLPQVSSLTSFFSLFFFLRVFGEKVSGLGMGLLSDRIERREDAGVFRVGDPDAGFGVGQFVGDGN